MVEHIRKNGLLNPIWIHNRQIVEGRNRWRACKFLGKKMKFKTWKLDGPISLLDFIVGQNLVRRHLNVGQRSMIAKDLKKKFAAEAKEAQREHSGTAPGKAKKTLEATVPQVSDRAPQARDKAAELMHVSARSVQNAQTIDDADPKVAEKVRTGAITIAQGLREAGCKGVTISEDTRSRIGRMQWIWQHCTDAEKKEFRQWIKTH